MIAVDLKEKFLETVRTRKWETIALVVILFVGVFLRTYHFSDWLHFELDQAYDFNTVSPAITDGIGHLSLLGPNVGGSDLRLGPAFYYLEYVSALLLGNTPAGHAGAVLVLSLLSLPLFYVFCRRYFTVIESLGLLALFSTSLYGVLYSRFSWSPNVLPFLMLLSGYALLRSVSSKEPHPARWFLIAVTAVTVTSQIHLNSFFSAPLIALLFVVITRPKFNWKIWLSAVGIVLFLYSPVILNDIRTGGENLHLLKAKLMKTNARITLPQKKIAQDIEYNAYEYLFIATGNDQINGTSLTDYGFSCDSCSDNLPFKLFALTLFASASSIFLFSFFGEKNTERKNFLLLTGLWFLVSLALFYTVVQGYRMYPRFFLIVSPLALIWYGFLLTGLNPKRGRIRFILFGAVILLLVGMNTRKILPVFDQLRNVTQSQSGNAAVGDIFPNTNRMTLEEEQAIVDYIVSQSRPNGYPVYLSVKSEYRLALWSLLEQRGIHHYDEIGDQSLFTDGNYFDIRFALTHPSNDPKFSTIASKNFGMMTVSVIRPLPQYIVGEEQPATDRKPLKEMQILSTLHTWSE